MILVYHKVFSDSLTKWWVDVDNFYRQMCELRCKEVVYLDDYDPDDPNQVVITFDDAYENIVKYAVPILNKFSYPFEVFINGDGKRAVSEWEKDEPKTKFCSINDLKEIIASKGRLQWHTNSHSDLTLIKSWRKVEGEISVPKKFIQLDKRGFKWFSYPFGQFNEEIVNLVKKSFQGAVSCSQGNDIDRYKLKRIEVNSESSFKKASVGVVITVFNYGCFLVEAIESVLRQTRPVDEIIIADDCSTDNTYEIALAYQKKYPSLIKVNRNKRNIGIVKNNNKAFALSKTDYICTLDADNRFRSDYIEQTAGILDSDERIAIAYTDFAFFGTRAIVKYSQMPAEWRGKIREDYYMINFPEFNDRTKVMIEKLNFIHGNSLFKREAYKQVGGYMDDKDRQEDHNLFWRIVKAGWLAKKTSTTLLEYRQHSKDQENNRFNFFAELNFYKDQLHFYKDQFLQAQDELSRIKSSKFWKLLFIYKNPKQGVKNYGPKLSAAVIRLFSSKLHKLMNNVM